MANYQVEASFSQAQSQGERVSQPGVCNQGCPIVWIWILWFAGVLLCISDRDFTLFFSVCACVRTHLLKVFFSPPLTTETFFSLSRPHINRQFTLRVATCFLSRKMNRKGCKSLINARGAGRWDCEREKEKLGLFCQTLCKYGTLFLWCGSLLS